MKKVIKFFETYKSGAATIVALLAMLITNFAVDAPLTTYLTNKLNEKSAKKMELKAVGGEKNEN